MERLHYLSRIVILQILLALCFSYAKAQVSAAFTAQTGCNGEVTFIATNTGYTNYFWLFGDAATGSGVSAFHKYTTGTYNATLIVQNNGSYDSLSQQIYISDYVQQQLTGPTVACLGSDAIFSLSNTSGSLQYTWLASGGDIVGSNHGTQAQVSFTSPGPSVVSAIVSNGAGCDSILQLNIQVQPNPNLILAGIGSDSTNIQLTICQNAPVWYNVVSTTGSNGFISWSSGSGIIQSAQGKDSMLFVFPNAGGTYLTISETTSAGCTDTITALVDVTESPATTVSGVNACLGTDNLFTATTAQTGIMTYNWLLDDGTYFNTNPVTHTFSSTGAHTAQVIVTNRNGCSDTALTTVQVDATAGPAIECVGPICAGAHVVYSTAPAAGVSYHWSVTGGVITADGGLSDHTVEVQWGNGSIGTISLYLTGPGVYCQFPTVEQVNIVGGNLAIQGKLKPCAYTMETYSTDIVPGGVYTWTATNGSIQSGQGTHQVEVYFYPGANSQISVQVSHQILSCNSQASLNVNPLNSFDMYAPTEACVGTPTLLQTGYNDNFTWTVQNGTLNSGNGTNTASVTWQSAGIYSVTATNLTNYCNTISTKQVKVIDLPLESIKGADKTCIGTTENYEISPNYDQFNWTVPAGGTVSGNNNSNALTVSWTTAGTHTLQVTYTDFSGCSKTSSYNVTVAPEAVPTITGDTLTCYGNTETYSFTPVAGIDYVWEAEGGIVTAGQNTSIATILWQGTQTGVLRLRNTVCNTYLQKNIVIRPTPEVNIQARNLTCTGASADLKVVEDYPTYLWSNSLTAQTITINTPGIYAVTITDSKGCTATGSLNANPIPSNAFISAGIAGNAPVGPIPYAYIKLTAYGTPAPVSYVWNTGNTEATQYTNTAGVYTVTMTNEYGCTTQQSVTVTVSGGQCSGGGGSCSGGGVILPCPGITPVFTINNPVCNPVQFTPGVVATYYHWDFNDGVYNTSASPSHHFNSPGTKTVTMIYSNDGNTWYECSQSFTINAVMNLSFTQTDGCKGAVTLTNTSSSTLPINSVSWQMGDGNTVTGSTINYQYPNNASSYNITLSVNDGVCTDVLQKTIQVSQLVTDFVYTGICTNNPALFNDATTHSDLISSYTWVFGNTETADYRNPVTYYTTAGNYTASLTIKDAEGCLDTHTENIVVANFAKPVVTASGPTTFCRGSSVSLSLAPGNRYYWNNSETTPTTTINRSGDYYARVTEASTGCSGFSDTVGVTVNIPPRAYITNYEGKTEYCAQEQLTLRGRANANVTFQWYKNNITLQNSAYVSYWSVSGNESGVYQVVITDGNGCKDTSDQLNVLVHPLPATPTATQTPQGGACEGSPVTLSITGNDIYTWSNGASGNSVNVYQGGYYQVIATNNFGCTRSNYAYATINPVPDFSYFPTGCYQICENDNITVNGPAGQSGYLWSNGATSRGITLTTSGDYSLSATANGACSLNSPSFHVDVFDAGNIQLGADTFICQGQTVLLDAGAYTSFIWQDNSTAQTFTVTDTGTYHVQVTNNAGCTSGDTIHISSFGSFLSLGNDTLLCAGQTLLLNPGVYLSYQWQDNSTNATYLVTDSGLYVVQVTTTGGCTAKDSIHVSTTGRFVNLGNDTTICQGTNLILSPGNFLSYQWQDNSTAATYAVMDSGLYFVQVNTAGGCTASDSIHVAMIHIAVNLGNDTTVCAGNNVLLNPGSFAGYIWQNNSTSQFFTAIDTGIYYVQVTNNQGCTARDSIHIAQLNATVNLGNDTTICRGDSLVLSPGIFSNYQWQNNSTAATYLVTQAGTYWVQINAGGGCTATDTISVAVSSSTIPLVLDTLCNSPIDITVPGNYTSFHWGTGAVTNYITVTDTGYYSVEVTNAFGCTVSGGVLVMPCDTQVNLRNAAFLLPSGFTPNGDGVNDVFYAIRMPNGQSVHYFEMYVFNRWGEEVFGTYNENDGWNGKFRGQDCGPGVFVYSVRYVSESGSVLQRGTVTLLR